MPAALLIAFPLPLQLLERLQSLTFLFSACIFVLVKNGVAKLNYFEQLVNKLAISLSVASNKCVITGQYESWLRLKMQPETYLAHWQIGEVGLTNLLVEQGLQLNNE